MSVELRDAVNGDGLMDIQGKGFFALDTLNTVRLTTVPDEVVDFLDQFVTLTLDLELQATVEGLPAAAAGWQSAGGGLSSKIRDVCRDLMIEMVQDDSDEPDRDLTSTLEFLVQQMEDDGNYVDANAITLTLAANSANIGDPAICYTTRRGDGRVQENALAEVIQIEVTSDQSETSPGLSFIGEEAVDSLAYDWPKGSGLNTSISGQDAAASLLSNGDFETTSVSNTPDDWTVVTGTPGTTVQVTDAEVQTVVIAGSPTGGSYQLYYTNASSITRATDPIAHNADASAVQTALRALPGLGGITVASSGTSPDYTHTITFSGVAGIVTALTSKNNMQGGVASSITHATTVGGDAGAYKCRALRINGNGSEKTELYHELTLEDEVVYCCHFRTFKGTTPEESSSSSSS